MRFAIIALTIIIEEQLLRGVDRRDGNNNDRLRDIVTSSATYEKRRRSAVDDGPGRTDGVRGPTVYGGRARSLGHDTGKK